VGAACLIANATLCQSVVSKTMPLPRWELVLVSHAIGNVSQLTADKFMLDAYHFLPAI
jgi:hypothetical protein